MLLGGRRPTGDLDFSIVTPNRRSGSFSEIEFAIASAADETRITVQYSADIDRWSQVAIPKSKMKTRFYKRFGLPTVHLLDPKCRAVYKLARYLDSDVADLLALLKRQKVSWIGLSRLCGDCLRFSPRSTQPYLFRRQVEHFFKEHERAIATFHRAAKPRVQ